MGLISILLIIILILISLVLFIYIFSDVFLPQKNEYSEALYKKFDLKYSDKLKNNGKVSDSAKIDFAYQMLGILDSKASALLRIDGIVLAFMALLIRGSEIASIVREKNNATEFQTCFDNIVIFMVFGLLMLSMLFSLYVVKVSWDFLGYVDLSNKNNPNKFKTECEKLGNEIYLRQAAYRLSWWMSLVSFFLIGYVISLSRYRIGNFL